VETEAGGEEPLTPHGFCASRRGARGAVRDTDADVLRYCMNVRRIPAQIDRHV
jgi:hypothetical protein